MAVSRKGISLVGTLTRTNTVIPPPIIQFDGPLTTINNGDLLVLLHYSEVLTSVPPPGFVPFIGLAPLIFPVHTNAAFWAWKKIAFNESGNYTITHPNTSAGAVLLVYAGQDPINIEDAAATTNSGNADPNLVSNGITVVTPGSRVINAGAIFNVPGGGFSSAPVGGTPTFNFFSPTVNPSTYSDAWGLVASDALAAVAGSIGNRTLTDGPPVDDWVMTQIAIRSGPEPGGTVGSMIAVTITPGLVDKTIRTLINEAIPDYIRDSASGRICELVIQNASGSTFIKGLAGVAGNASDGFEISTNGGVYKLRAPMSNVISIDDIIIGATPGTIARVLAYTM